MPPKGSRSPAVRWIGFAALASLTLLLPVRVMARSGGIVATSCSGCHGAETASVSATAMPSTFLPGDEIIVELTIRAAGIVTAGLYVESEESAGTFRTLSGEGLAQVTTGLTHSSPKRASNGASVFRFAWRAPAAAGSVRFNVYAVAANGDGSRLGDQAGGGAFDFVFGCAPATYYYDGDRDGFGISTITRQRCAGGSYEGWAAVAGDCDDTRPEVFPGAPEICNKRDDNCNGEVDEDAELVPLWPDLDGDGYYARQEGEPVIGCVPLRGYAAEPGDCDDRNAEIHPGAVEICNGYDDNCDGRVDERVRPRCGEGWCTRESLTCSPDACTPGDPTPERCNNLDDDCNGLVDDGETCGRGEVCVAGECMREDGLGTGGGAFDGGVPLGSATRKGGGCSSTGASGDGPPFGMSGLLLLLFLHTRRRRSFPKKRTPREPLRGGGPHGARSRGCTTRRE